MNKHTQHRHTQFCIVYDDGDDVVFDDDDDDDDNGFIHVYIFTYAYMHDHICVHICRYANPHVIGLSFARSSFHLGPPGSF